ncbi:unnamed protein product [Cylicostephanus goldi]|uniref:K Homology domain-containing protein n=1 Tax=Cylicostephanus goldi TaxID=71465 RepID=A0A3P6RIQ7_CYLGO|nr:unnamed protein product [Cylicostephanus goldi]
MKREHTDDDRYGNSRNSKRQRGDGFSEALAQGKFELRVLVSSKCAGAIIGKGGENIKRLRNQVRHVYFEFGGCRGLRSISKNFIRTLSHLHVHKAFE